MHCFDGIHFKVLQEPLFFWSLFATAIVPCKRLQMQEKNKSNNYHLGNSSTKKKMIWIFKIHFSAWKEVKDQN